MTRGPFVAATVVSVTLLAACSPTAAPTTTDGGSRITITTIAEPQTTTTSTAATTTTLPPIRELTAPEYQIVYRQPSGTVGDEVVVLLDTTTYDTLTDIDLHDIIAEVVELFPPISVLHVVDDADAADVVIDPDASEAERAVLANHYLARLEDGSTIVYLGPFAASGTSVLGS